MLIAMAMMNVDHPKGQNKAAVYKLSFQKNWTQKWLCIVAVTGKLYEYECTICNR